jgi:hypothetical protein
MTSRTGGWRLFGLVLAHEVPEALNRVNGTLIPQVPGGFLHGGPGQLRSLPLAWLSGSA